MNFPRDRPIVDWPTRPPRPRDRHHRLFLVAVLALLLVAGGTALSYYVDWLWFASLGYVSVFWTNLNIRATVFALFAGLTFVVLYGAFLVFKPERLNDITGGTILINGQPLQLPVEPVLRLIALAAALVVALATGAGMTADAMTLALYWYGPAATSPAAGAAPAVDPIFGRQLSFYLFTLPAWQLMIGWLTTMALMACGIAFFFIVITGGTRMISRGRATPGTAAWRGLSGSFAVLLLALAARVYLSRFDRLFADRVLFTGVTYTDAHVTLTGSIVVAAALIAGAVMAALNAVRAPRLRWLVVALAPAAVCLLLVSLIASYVGSFVVKPNELVRERPYLAHNIEMTRLAFGLNRIQSRAFPAEAGIDAVDLPNNYATIQNIRLWDWRALQDTLRQIQEIRTYYEFPDIDIDRYVVDGSVRQMMLAARELSIEKLPESSRNWINEKLIYTHGYGVTMNPVNGFTPEGLPALVLSDMPIRNTIPSIKVTRPEIYFGELTNADVYVRTRQQEFNYPQGETNSLTSYEGSGGIVIGGFFRRLLIALDRGDLAKLPFSDDVTAESRLLMRRNIRERVEALAPFLTFDPDPYIIVGEDGRLSWMLDGFTTSDTFPYSRHYRLGRQSINYVRNSVKAIVDAYDGTTTFYVFDREDPIITAYRAVFPDLFKDADAMTPGMRKHVRYPELLLQLQATVYGLYHMTVPEVFYNREDLWSVAAEIRLNERREQSTQPIEPNFVLMKLPGETAIEFVEILPFTPANRNNLIGWMAGRSDEPHYGTIVAFDFPKSRLVDGPLQIEARIDQNSQLSGQLSLWNQQGSRVLRGTLLVIPVGRALLYAEPIYLQAERSPMPELRVVVLALQDRLVYAPTFEAALAALFGNAASSLAAPSGAGVSGAAAAPAERRAAAAAGPGRAAQAPASDESDALITEAARSLADYQRLTAEGKLGEAGQKLEQLKRTLDDLQRRQR
jgi:uncharacterized membrane protein (UPF0182 family)